MSFEETTVTDVGTVRVLHAPRELDVYTVPDMRTEVIESVAAGHYHLVVDVSATTYIDPAGLGLLVGTLKRVRERGGSLVLAGPLHESLDRVMRLSGLVKVFDIADSVDAAVAARAGA